MPIIDPYRAINERALRRLRSLSDAEFDDLLKEAGILDENGDPLYETSDSDKPRSRKLKRRAGRYIGPDREFILQGLRRLRSLSQAHAVELMKEVGLLDKRGNLAKKYRTPEPSKVAQPKPAKRARRKRAAS